MIKQAMVQDFMRATELAMLLWPGHDVDEMEETMKDYIFADQSAIYLYFEETIAVGLAICTLRNDYVEGTHTSPVGYLEGIYVREDYQKQGIARKLLAQCEKWAKYHGCLEFASDCELDNTDSLAFHLSVGFKEANRVICFMKKL
ncbi:MAG TPA: GNAT family N-acetyltransferase [Firmicutes bacterium]|nr:GNAT family N-acetyltransferase [Bacillota bacterium]